MGEQERKGWGLDWLGDPHRNVFCLFSSVYGHDRFSVLLLRATVFYCACHSKSVAGCLQIGQI